jgi:hypothetical protein
MQGREGAHLGGRAEGIGAVAAKGVPEGDGEAEPLRHCLAGDHLRLVVVAEGEGVVGRRVVLHVVRQERKELVRVRSAALVRGDTGDARLMMTQTS